MRGLAWIAATLALLAGAPAAAQTDDVVGVAKRVRGAAELLAAQGRDKLLAPGDRVRMNDVVRTGANGSALLQLIDASAFTIGPNASIRIDRFVYEPNRGGAAFVSLIEGAMRFASGQIAKRDPGAMTIATPFGTIGVRGTVAAVETGAGGATIVLLDPQGAAEGALVVRTAAGEVRLSAPGEGVRISAGGPPPVPRAFSEEEVNALLGRIGPGERWTRMGDAADPGAAAVATISAAECAALERAARLSPDYQPGVDAHGRAVTPAEGTFGRPREDFTIPLTIDVLRAAGIETGFAGIEGGMALGEIRVRGGRATLAGELLDPTGQAALLELCRGGR